MKTLSIGSPSVLCLDESIELVRCWQLDENIEMEVSYDGFIIIVRSDEYCYYHFQSFHNLQWWSSSRYDDISFRVFSYSVGEIWIRTDYMISFGVGAWNVLTTWETCSIAMDLPLHVLGIVEVLVPSHSARLSLYPGNQTWLSSHLTINQKVHSNWKKLLSVIWKV